MLSFVITLAVLASAEAAVVEPSPATSPKWVEQADSLLAHRFAADRPGCAAGVARDGRLVFAKGFGLANVELGVPIDAASVFNAGSISKQFTAFAALLLVEEGKVALEDDVRRFVPELPVYDPDRPITLDHLLHHTSGLRDVSALLGYSGMREGPSQNQVGRDWVSRRQQLDMIVRQRDLTSPPGVEFTYSNTGYVLMALVVERVSGLTFGEFTRTRIFEPLGMDRTAFVEDLDVPIPGRAQGYHLHPDGRLSIDDPWFPILGSSGLYTTVHDLSLWERNYFERTIGRERTFELMLARGRRENGEEIPYGRGLFLRSWKGRSLVEHGGSTFGFQSYLLRLPEEALSVMLLCNVEVEDKRSLALATAGAVLGLAPSTEDAEAPHLAANRGVEAAPADIEGVYRVRGLDRWVAIVHTDEGWVARISTGYGDTRSRALTEVGDRRFDISGLSASLVVGGRRDDGSVPVTLVRPGEDPAESALERQPRLVPEELSSLAGDYYSPDLDVTYRIARKEDELHLEVLRYGGFLLAPGPMEVVGPALFLLADGHTHLQFMLEPGRPSAAFELITRRGIKLRFERTSFIKAGG